MHLAKCNRCTIKFFQMVTRLQIYSYFVAVKLLPTQPVKVACLRLTLFHFSADDTTHGLSHMSCLLYRCYDLFLGCRADSFDLFFLVTADANAMATAEAWQWRDGPWAASEQKPPQLSCPSEVKAHRTEYGWVHFTGSARVPRVSGAPGRLGEGPSLSAHLLPSMSPGHPGLARGAALPRVPDVGGVRRGRTAEQHPPRAPSGWHQAEASGLRVRRRRLRQRHIRSCGAGARERNQGPGRSGCAAPTRPGEEHCRPGEYPAWPDTC